MYTIIPDIYDLTSDAPENISECSSGKRINEYITKLESISNKREIDALVSRMKITKVNHFDSSTYKVFTRSQKEIKLRKQTRFMRSENTD
ncbi:unnamed protein product [Debaryomyces tyrocola]|nr:unnamed protein product [Debaryomyces tyrocola]